MSGAMPPPLPSRANWKPVLPTTHALSSDIKSCDCPKGKCIHSYDYLQERETDQNLYDQLNVTEELDFNDRLKKIEDNQIRLRLEFSQFRDDVAKDIRSLRTSIKEMTDLSKSFEVQMRESSKLLKDTMDRVHLSQLENSDHLGKQILDVRRDILALSKNIPLPLKKH